jgi:hypothetical protein
MLGIDSLSQQKWRREDQRKGNCRFFHDIKSNDSQGKVDSMAQLMRIKNVMDRSIDRS